MDAFTVIRQQIIDDPDNAWAKQLGYEPIYTASATACIVIVGQAPGTKAQTSGIPWGDASGDTLRRWMGVSDAQFYDESLVALIPMDFYFPGRGKTGDLPPRNNFAATWHPQLLAHMPNVQLILLVGRYAQDYYLATHRKHNLTETVRAYQEYLPEFFPLVHPSPLNFRWQTKNPWFQSDIVPVLQQHVTTIISSCIDI